MIPDNDHIQYGKRIMYIYIHVYIYIYIYISNISINATRLIETQISSER